MTETTHARPVFRGPLDGQRPRPVRSLGGDPWLFVAVVALLALGVVMVFNVGYFHGQQDFRDPYHFFRKHVVSIGVGLAACLLTSRLPTATWRRMAYPLLVGSIVSLVLVLVPGIGVVRGGARRWLHLGPLVFQPTEVAKFALVLFLAHSLAKKGPRVREFALGIVPHCLVVGVIALLCLLEPDFGTVVLSAGVLVAMLFVGGVRVLHLAALAIPALPLVVYEAFHAGYRMQRLLVFLDPMKDPQGVGFQLLQSLIAFGSGQVWGVGLGESRQKMFYLPAAHTDFIFSVIGEELGLAGAVLVLGLFAALGVRGFRIAVRHPDPFASLFAFGVTLLLLLEAAVNICVVLGCLPTKGLALPFVSYGGSAVLLALAEVGVLLAVAREAG
ncbi:MAG: putative lipid II flippase FtsW [Candidatus Binatia bacterium]